MRSLALAAAAAALAACAATARPAVSPVRFANADPAWRVAEVEVPAAPAARADVGALRGFDIAVTDRLDRLLSARPRRRALGTNSLDEVPDSTWFENRIGARDVSLDELARGPGDGVGPDRSAPLRVISAKAVGKVAGFLAEDAAGIRWLIKFEPHADSAESATDIAVQRLLWLAGYHVPENHVAHLHRDDVRLGDGAKVKDARGRKRAMTEADLDATFARALPDDDGRYRVLASRLIDGTPIGSTPPTGVRADDPNDTIPHERRRELRGLYVFAAWLQHTDFKEMGTLDVWRDRAVHHYLLDFGNSLGQYARNARPDDGHVEKVVDLDHLRSLVSLGLWRRPWEGTPEPGIPGVGAFDAEHFDPGGFTPFAPYAPFLEADAADARWAVKILLRITRDHLRAALEAGRFDDPRAVDYLVDVLAARQRKTAIHWLSRVSPIDDVTVAATGRDGRADVCFVDLAVAHDLWPGATVAYAATAYDWDAAPLGVAAVDDAPGRDGRRCARGVPLGRGHDDYTIVRLDVTRDGHPVPALEVHLARRRDGALRVIGLEPRL